MISRFDAHTASAWRNALRARFTAGALCGKVEKALLGAWTELAPFPVPTGGAVHFAPGYSTGRQSTRSGGQRLPHGWRHDGSVLVRRRCGSAHACGKARSDDHVLEFWGALACAVRHQPRLRRGIERRGRCPGTCRGTRCRIASFEVASRVVSSRSTHTRGFPSPPRTD